MNESGRASWPTRTSRIGRIPDGGWRVHGRALRATTRDRTVQIGFDHVHSLVDDHSRLACSEILPDEKGPTCAGFLARAIAYFTGRGITRVERLMTDNAWAYRWSLREICARHGIRQKFIKPHCPWLEHYNTQRRHSALGGHPPIRRLAPT